MKWLILTILFFPVISYGQDRWDTVDKRKHFYLSGHISLMAESGQLKMDKRYLSSFEVFSLVAVVTSSKEYLLDEKPSRKDMAANVLGSALGVLTAKWLTWKF